MSEATTTVPDDARALGAGDASGCCPSPHTADASPPAADPGTHGVDSSSHGGEAHQHGYITAKDNYLRRLRRIEGQARGLQRMVEEEKYCIDILTQVSAMTKALQAVALELLEDHMAHCVVAAAREGGAAAEEKIQEASEAIARLVRS